MSSLATAYAGQTNPGVIEIDPSAFDRVLAISDVHGMHAQLNTLLTAAQVIDSSEHWRAGKTLLVIIGDSIDKGPQSLEVLQLWMDLTDQAPKTGGRVVHLLGNHEAEFLANPHSDNAKASELVHELAKKGLTPEDFANPQSKTGAFLLGLPIAAKIGGWLFAHSGAYPDMAWNDFKAKATKDLQEQKYDSSFVTGETSILETKKWERDPSSRHAVEDALTHAGILGVVFGHQPKGLGVEGWSAMSDDHRLIKIDNGMAPQAGAHEGTLLEFAAPGELIKGAPSVHVITPQGKSAPLRPESTNYDTGSID